jgi:moderate conductance mechanosensitive channel
MLLQTTQEPAIWTLEWLKDHGPRIGLLIALAVLVSWLGRVAVRRFRRRLEGSGDTVGLTAAVTLHRTTTLVGIVTSAIRVVVWTVVVFLVLDELGFNLGPLLAGAGVIGIALGFGAQSLVRDFLAGFFILFENQYGVGETVELSATGGAVAGRVEVLSLRSTSVRATDGTLSVVPNGNIQFAANKSRGLGELTVDVKVPTQLDTGEVRLRLDQVVEELKRDGRLRGRLAAGPEVASVEPAEEQGVVVKVKAATRPSRREEVQNVIRSKVEQELRPARSRKKPNPHEDS